MTTDSGMPTTCDPSHPLPPPRDGIIAAFLAAPPSPPAPCLLDSLETSERELANRYHVMHGSPAQSPSDFALDLTSWSAKYRHRGWSPTRRRVWRSLLRTDQATARVQAFATCGNHARIMRANEAPDRYVVQSNCCHDRLCTPCALSRSIKVREALARQIGDRPTTFLTLTLRHHGEALTELVDRLYSCFRSLRKHPLWETHVEGGACFLEVKRTEKNNGWHPHLHIIMDARYIDFTLLQHAWHSITGGSFQIRIERVGDAGHVSRYVTKYVTKTLDSSYANTEIWLDEAVNALKGRRLCLCFGTWYGTPLTDAEEGELADDIIDAGGYHYYADFGEMLRRCWEGDRDAWDLIRSCGLGGHALATFALH